MLKNHRLAKALSDASLSWGQDLPFVAKSYDRPEDFSGERVIVVGGGRSADWAATELYDAGKQVYYVMRQPFDNHWRLISDSRYGLPYYARLAEIMEIPRSSLSNVVSEPPLPRLGTHPPCWAAARCGVGRSGNSRPWQGGPFWDKGLSSPARLFRLLQSQSMLS